MVAETAFRSDEEFDQEGFRHWLGKRPSSDLNHYELIHGRIVMTPPAGWPHGCIEARLVSMLEAHVRAKRLGMVLGSSTGYDLPSGDTVEPDVSFISAQRFAAGPKPESGRFLKIVPNLAVEILSPSTARHDRTEKKEVYQNNGVDEYWLVDIDARAVTILPRSGAGFGAAQTFTEGSLRSAILPGLELDVGEIFAL